MVWLRVEGRLEWHQDRLLFKHSRQNSHPCGEVSLQQIAPPCLWHFLAFFRIPMNLCCCCVMCRRLATGLTAATSVGEYVSIGQGCLLRSTMIESESLIGDKCILLEGSLVETNAVLAPGSVLPAGRLVPSGQLWAGNPARYVRDLTKDEVWTTRVVLFLFLSKRSGLI